MSSKKIIIKTPHFNPICDRNCNVEPGKFMITNSRKCNNIIKFFETHDFSHIGDEYWKFMSCENYDAFQFVKKCKIIDNNPAKDVIKFFEKHTDNEIIENLEELVNNYVEVNYSDESSGVAEEEIDFRNMLDTKKGASQVAGILSQLRKDGRLQFINEKIILKNEESD